MDYSGWELKFFDASKNFRNYQYNLVKDFIGKKILEVGPGTGNFAENFLLKKSENIYLAEINKDLALDLENKFKDNKNVSILPKKINEINIFFDTICYFDVIEHIKFPEEELSEALNKLEKNGHLIVIVPAYNYLFSDYDKAVGHYKRYEKQFFIDYIKKNNLKCEKLIYFDSIGYMFLLLNKIIKSKKSSVGFATLIWNLLIPLSKLIDMITLNYFGKSLLCIMRK
tara:strand:+ start:1071 stop:1751 length:681 start_codon:yes stop_codon:yes gene_type:complete